MECRAAGCEVRGRDRRVPEGGPGAAARVTNACCPGAPRLSALSMRITSSDPVREHRRAEAAQATINRGWECRDQRAELTLTGKMPGERAEGNEAQVLGVIDISGLSAHC